LFIVIAQRKEGNLLEWGSFKRSSRRDSYCGTTVALRAVRAMWLSRPENSPELCGQGL
jgi:hypothetical protein